MQAVILAAGMGKRLKELTKDNTKCMVKVNGETLVERLLHMLDRKNLSRVVIVVGYKGKELMEYIGTLGINTEIVFIDNPIYNTTNNIYSLSLADEYLVSEDTLLFESDLIFEEAIVDKLINDKRETLAVVDKFESWMDGSCMILDEADNITDFISGKLIDFSERDIYYKTVNIYKFSKNFSEKTYVPFLEAYRKAMGQNEYYETVIKLISMLGTNELKALRLDGQVWYEIDDVQDLDIAESLFAKDSLDKYKMISSRYGGYWRYPKLLDFCYLVNPYFPPKRMLQEIRANMDLLLTQYPSGMRVNSLLAARNFGVKQEHIVIGNGAAELIKEFMRHTDMGRCGIIRPTFEEYPNRYNEESTVMFCPDNENFSYTEDDLINFFEDKNINSLILINPDNPTGNYITYGGLMKLIDWAKQNNIILVIDESFSDFADVEGPLTIIDEKVLEIYDDLYVVKSISKSFGVPGLRLGIMASHNKERIEYFKKEMAIWNINSFAEFYMQIYEKYEKDYKSALKKHIVARERLVNGLESVEYLRVMPSQANYVCCEILGGRTSEELAARLLEDGIFIKNLTGKIGNGKEYIRIAVRTVEENEYLIQSLKEVSY